jgi:hypothetical protein
MNENHEMMAGGNVDLNEPQVLTAMNAELAELTAEDTQTPHIAWARVQKVLATYHVFIPNGFLEGPDGNEVIPLNQFGKISGQTNDGKILTNNEVELFLYFEWAMAEDGRYTVFTEVVDEKDLKEILSDYDSEEQLEEDKDPCWKGYERVGMKKKNGRNVPNCVPVSEERGMERNFELRRTRQRILKKVGERIDKKDPHLNHPAGYAKRALKVVKKIDDATTEKQIDEVSSSYLERYLKDLDWARKKRKEPKHKKGHKMAVDKLLKKDGCNKTSVKIAASEPSWVYEEEQLDEISSDKAEKAYSKAVELMRHNDEMSGMTGKKTYKDRAEKRRKQAVKFADYSDTKQYGVPVKEANEPFDGPYVQKGKEKSNPDRRAATIADKAMRAARKKANKKLRSGFTRKELQDRYDSLEYKGD